MSAATASFLVDRLCQPRRVGLFGRRGVGKTTLLTMLYREATQGRIPGIRLAAGDERTAEYLRDKIAQLERGEPLPATLAQSELRFHLYAGEKGDHRIELLVLDYQGEHVELGQSDPIRAFFQSCDVVLLALDSLASASQGTQAEMEIEQLIERYLAQPPEGEAHRPMALLRMKSDRSPPTDERFASQTMHSLAMHHAAATPAPTTFAVASFQSGEGPVPTLEPQGLGDVLVWLAETVHRLDAARLAHLFRMSASVPQKRRGLQAFIRAYPEDPLGGELAPEVRIDWPWWRRVGCTAAALLLLTLGVALYDRWGAASILAEDARLRDDPRAAYRAWQRYERWHPTRSLFGSADPARARATAYAAALAELETRLEQDDLASVRHDLDQLGRQFTDVQPPEALGRVREQLAQRREEQGRQHLADLTRREATADWPSLLNEAHRLAQEHGDLAVQAEFDRKAQTYRDRIDERAFQEAVDYSRHSPRNYLTRRQRYYTYLERFPEGNFASAARTAITRVSEEWDRADYRKVREQFVRDAGAIEELRTLGRAYLATHPDGTYRDAVTGLLRWCDQVSEPGEYTVRLVSGVFDRKSAFWASRGVCPVVTIEVAGIPYGPSPIVRNNYTPQWDFEFPRKIRWKNGDTVRVIVTDHYFWKRTIADLRFDGPTAMQQLSDLVDFKNGSVRFESDFKMPTLPRAD
jgi:hypothetical protein